MLSASGCRGRVGRLRAALGAGLDGAIIARPEHLLYFANHFPLPNSLNLSSASFLLIRKDGSTTLFTDNWLVPSSEAAVDEIIVVEWYNGKEPARDRLHAVAGAAASHIRAEGLRSLGAEVASLPALIAQAVEQLTDIEALLLSLREIKDPDEVMAIRLALRAGEAVHAASRGLLAPGMREIDYYAALLEQATVAAERPFVMMCDLASGERAAARGGAPTTRVMRGGDLVILDFFPYVDGYRCDITNTLCVGAHPTDAQREAFARAESALAAGEAQLHPGTPVAQVFAAMDAALRVNGRDWSLVHHGGHGLGLGHPEPPHVVPRSDRTLSAGMVLALEPGVYDPSFGGVRVEHNYLITPEGFERLSAHSLGL